MENAHSLQHQSGVGKIDDVVYSTRSQGTTCPWRGVVDHARVNMLDDRLDELENLEIPATNLLSLARHFGPGMILMMTGIGTSHLVTAPVAGGRFGHALLWCIPLAYVFKYYGFEMAFRFTHATGCSMLDAYATAWKKWPLWYVLITTLIQCAIGQAGRLIAASAVLYYFFATFLGISIPTYVFGFCRLQCSSAAITARWSWRPRYRQECWWSARLPSI